MSARAPLLLFLAAFLVRALHVLDLAGNPFFAHPVIDAAEYDEWARAIRAGDLLSSGKGAFWQPPLYPYLLAALYFLLGQGYLAARLAQAAMGAASCVLLCGIGTRLAGRRAGLAAGAGAALYWPFVFHDGELLSAGLQILLDLALLRLLLRAADAPGRLASWWPVGLALGLGALNRPTSLLLAPAMLAWLWIERARLGRGAALRGAAAALSVVAVLVSLTAWRNSAIGREPVLISSNGGMNFYLGNNPDYDRTVGARPGARWTQLLRLAPYEAGGTASGRSRHYTALALRWMAARPGEAAALYLKKFCLFWNAHEIRRDQDPYFMRRYSRFLGPPLLGFAVVGPLGALGLVVSAGRARRFALPYLFFAAHMAGVLLFFVTSRYRIAAMPYLLLFAVLALEWIAGAWRARRGRALAGAAAVWGAFLALALTDPYGVAHPAYAREHYELGLLAEASGDAAAARGHFTEAIELDPTDPDVYVHLAIAELARGDGASARRAVDRAIELMPDCADAWFLRGTMALEGRDFAGAEEALRRSLALNVPGARGPALARLGAALLEQGQPGEAERVAREALVAEPGQPEAQLLLALILARSGHRREAAETVRAVLARYPEHRAARRMMQELAAP